MKTILILLLCAFGISIGQILFKTTAMALNKHPHFWNLFISPTFIIAIFIYGITTIGWVLTLRKVELVRAYPFMALAFVIVPLISRLIFKEQINIKYFIGIIFICGGIFLTLK